jgi:hypothetical protein
MSGIDDMIRAAEKTLGLGEPNYIQDWYRKEAKATGYLERNFSWCDAAVTYWAFHSGNQGAVTFGHYYCATTTHAKAFNDHRKWHVDVAGIRKGDIVFFDWGHTNNISGIDHVGVVTAVSGKNVHTIEGNTLDKCARRVRTAIDIVGYGRPDYSNKPSKYEPFPGANFFVTGKKSPIIAAMHKRLVAEGCDHYKSKTNTDTWGSGDKASYAAWQHKLGYSGKDADGVPGATSWDKLQVPNV